ncbi:MAG: bifunctional 23S rRNA (guanine(2069)-N(7))-methyltransferase RlmK/23S rRNA (guanine(2445)-N(2))-methyltransferase RlmL, partial [Steroidobacteraceae bacterium]|nr:bifunctional 23S rRNA (guanine(2069)-N(7))-methyltransferase RlmK/23S rRNA (guanine(2445)-N(2))-methyltransferase RlmL [Steroidobacteraceae bacterium]MDW8260857.1 bifunctional 23S rRNA (guanine(2069)-N(7))-methyltransferase RlmK/23S rRNA (guanine(2445)-N(2))-methyltransferase RlmL [Gammaproteobacteria bacterium]
MKHWHFVASAPLGLVDLLAAELRSLGAEAVREAGRVVRFRGPLACAYRACLESRVASRIFCSLFEFQAADARAFYDALRAYPWHDEFAPGASLACEFSGQHPAIVNTLYGAQLMKDAIVDELRVALGMRPPIDTAQPGLRVHAHARGTAIEIALDLAGEGLHKRGYRSDAGAAPLRENLAAGILLRAGWPQLAAQRAAFLDPLCGSGTFVIEAAMIAADIAPQLERRYFGFLGWRRHEVGSWETALASARERAERGLESLQRRFAAEPWRRLRGSDRDAAAVRVARDNAARAGVAPLTEFAVGELADARPPAGAPAGLLVANPPYGQRLDDRDAARAVHRLLGQVLREHFVGWQAAVLTGAPEVGHELHLRAARTHRLWNGPLECRLLRFGVTAQARPLAKFERAATPGAQMFANRLRKNVARLGRWAQRAAVDCYRLYDADMPEYAFAIDRYLDEASRAVWLYVQEYAPPADIPPADARRRRAEAFAVLPEVTGVPPERIVTRTRRPTARYAQYEKTRARAPTLTVTEQGLRFLVQLGAYIDTGLFLDQRLVRERLRRAASGRRFLNLFAYTGAGTVYAAAGGAVATISVDLSNTYLDWARRNMDLNGFGGRAHRYVRADCREWL